MSALARVTPPQLDNFSAVIMPPASVQLIGVLAIPEPTRVLGNFFQALHRAVTQDNLPEISVDIRRLTFVNSSAIRLFVDWATWVRGVGPGEGYLLRFRTDRRITWQRTSFSVLQSLAPQSIVVDSE